MMTRQTFPTALALCALAAGCNKPPVSEAPVTPTASVSPAALPTAAPSTAAPVASATPAAPSAPVLVPEAEKGEKGARNVLIEWARAIEQGDWPRAAAQYGPDGGVSADNLRSRFGPLGRVTVSFGHGEVEAAAGSLYYAVPFSAAGSGRTVSGEVTLRRVNDVDGASPAQLRWHIAAVTYN